jgi:hypothetical protein
MKCSNHNDISINKYQAWTNNPFLDSIIDPAEAGVAIPNVKVSY